MAYSPKDKRLLKPLTWLHLSDLHIGNPGKDLWVFVQNSFRQSIEGNLTKYSTQPDVIFITGDIAFSARDEEYRKFIEFRNNLYDWLGSEPPIICVPGNHDVSRPKIKAVNLVYTLFKEYTDNSDTLPNDVKGAILDIKKRLDERRDVSFIDQLFVGYSNFFNTEVLPRLKENGIQCFPSKLIPGDIKVDITLAGRMPLTVIGLNSTWLNSTKDNYKQKLAIELAQLNALFDSDPTKGLKKLEDSASILLMHHPLNWLNKYYSQIFVNEIYGNKRFSVCLHGHMHEPQFFISNSDYGSKQSYFQASSLFGLEKWGTGKGEDRSFGYAWGQLNNDESIQIWPYQYAKETNSFNYYYKKSSYANENKGITIASVKKSTKNKDSKPIGLYHKSNVNPYRHFGYFDSGDRLYGMDHFKEDVVKNVKKTLKDSLTNCFIGIKGCSGCGKSSLLRAGVQKVLIDEGYNVTVFSSKDFFDEKGKQINVIQRVLFYIYDQTGLEIDLDLLNGSELSSPSAQAQKAVELISDEVKKNPLKELIIGLDQFEEILDELSVKDSKNNWIDLVEFIKHAIKSQVIGFIYTFESSRENIVKKTPLKSLINKKRCIDIEHSNEFYKKIIVDPFSDAGYPLDKKDIEKLLTNIGERTKEMNGNEVGSLLPLVSITLFNLFEIIKEKALPLPPSRYRDPRDQFNQKDNLIDFDKIGIDQDQLDIENSIKKEADKAMIDADDKYIHRSAEEKDISHFLRPLIGIIDPASDSFVLRTVPLHPYPDDNAVAEAFCQHRLLIRKGQTIRLVHEAVIRFWKPAREWVKKEKERLVSESNLRKNASKWKKERKKNISTKDPKLINEAAETLLVYRRVWPLFSDHEIDQNDLILRDYCLIIFGNSQTPTNQFDDENSSCHVHLAAEYGQTELLDKFILIDKNCFKLSRTKDKRTPLACATWSSHKSVHYLMDKGASAIKKDKNNWRPIAASILMGNKKIFDLLIESYSKQQLQDWPGDQSALHMFGFKNLKSNENKNHSEMSRYLIEERHLNPNRPNIEGNTPLHLMALRGNNEIFDNFIERSDVDVNLSDENGNTALHLSAFNGHTKIILRLLSNENFMGNGFNEFTKTSAPIPGCHALHIAVLEGYYFVVKLLLDKCSDPNITVKSEKYKGQTALHLAVCYDSFDSHKDEWELKKIRWNLVKNILANPGINPNVLDVNNKAPLALVKKEDSDILKLLLQDERIAPDLCVSRNGSTALLLAAGLDDEWKLVEKLMSRSTIDFNLTNNENNSLLHLMLISGAPIKLIKKILPNNPSFNVVNDDGYTPLMIAAKNNDLEFVELLLNTNDINLFSPSKTYGTPISVAIRSDSSLTVFDKIFKRNRQTLLSSNKRGWTALHYANIIASENSLLWFEKKDETQILATKRDSWNRRAIDLAPPKLQMQLNYESFWSNISRSWDSDLKWQPIDRTELQNLKDKHSPVDKKYEITDTTKAEVAKLSFYDHKTVSIARLSDKQNWNNELQLYFFLEYMKDGLSTYRLNGSSPPIHELNSKVPIHLNNENVLDYLRFFCSFVRGDDGPFLIAESVQQTDMPSDIEVKKKSELNKHLRPAKLFDFKDDKFMASATVYYGEALFFADFIIEKKGMIDMVVDLPILDKLPKNNGEKIS